MSVDKKLTQKQKKQRIFLHANAQSKSHLPQMLMIEIDRQFH